MPRLCKVRMANISLDNGYKVIPDSTWDLDGKSTLFLLENGGGKTSYIQLMLQTILPNTPLANRKLKELVAKGSNGHIATEWRLEGDYPKYLTLGFSFHNEQGKQGDLQYFSYLFTYGDDSSLTLKTLPFTQGVRVTTLTELQRFLHHQKEARVEIFRTNHEFRDAMRKYQILPEEWESIRKINGEEGDVEGFFEKAKTENQLIKKLLIPSVEDVIFHTSGEKEELYRSFHEYKENLLKIPETKKNLEDFGVVRSQGQKVLHASKELYQSKAAYYARIQELQQFYKGLEVYENTLEANLLENQQNLKELEEKQGELAWKLDSYPLNVKMQKRKNQQQALNQAQRVLKGFQEQYCKVEKTERELQAFKLYIDYQYYRQEAYKQKVQLDAEQKEVPELQAQLEKIRQDFFLAWNQMIGRIESNIQQTEEQLQTSILQEKELLQDQEKLINQRDKLKVQMVLWDQEEKRFRKELSELLTLLPCNMYEELKPYLGTLEEKQGQLREEQQSLNTLERQLREAMDTLATHQADLSRREVHLENKLQEWTKKESEYLRRAEEMKKTVSNLPYYLRDFWEEQGDLIQRLRRSLQTVLKEKQEAAWQAQSYHLQIARLKQYGSYVPHPQLIEVKEMMEKRDILVLLGSEWLAEQDWSEEEKRALLQKYPLLPFSLLFEERQFVQIERALAHWKTANTQIPLLFQRKASLEPKGDDLEVGVLFDLQQGNFVYSPDEVDLFISKEYLESHLEVLEQRYQEWKEKKDRLDEQEERIRHMLHVVQSFYNDYSKESVKQFTENIRSLKEELQQVAEQERQLSLQKHQIVAKEENLAQRRQRIGDELQSLNTSCTQINGFLRSHSDPKQVRTSLEEARSSYEQIQNKLDRVLQKRDHIVGVIAETEEELRNYRERKKEILEEGRIYDFKPNPAENRMPEEEYSELKGAVDGFQQQLKEQRQDYEDIQKLYNVYYNIMEKQRKRIQELDISFEWLEEHQRQVGTQEIEGVQKQRRSLEKSIENQEAQCKKIEHTLTQLQSKIDLHRELLQKEYKRDPYIYLDVEDYSAYEKKNKKVEEACERLKMQCTEGEKELQQVLNTLSNFAMLTYLPQSPDSIRPWNPEKWEGKPQDLFIHLRKQTENAREVYASREQAADKTVSGFFDALKQTGNSNVQRFSVQFQKLVHSDRLVDYEYIREQFDYVFKSLDAMEQHYKTLLTELEQDKEKLVQMIFRRVETIYENIMEMPKHSRIDLYEQRFHMLRIKWICFDDETALQKIKLYLEQLLQDLERMKRSGKEESETDSFLRNQLETTKLLECFAPLENCRVEIFKPRKESLLQEKVEYVSWSEAAAWSGGERYVSYMTMFMVLITHMRKRIFAQTNSWKTLVADNPFGKASSDHVVRPIIQLAKKSKIQLFTLTAISVESIRTHFPTVFSNRYYQVGGREILRTKPLQLGNIFYRKEKENNQ